MKNLNAAQVAEDWATRLGQTTAKIKRGVEAVTENPMEKAAMSADLWQQRVSDPATKQKFQGSLRGKPISAWSGPMIAKGIGRIASGAREAQPKMQQFLTAFLPHVANVQAQVAAMPKGDIAASEARMIANMRGMAAFRRS